MGLLSVLVASIAAWAVSFARVALRDAGTSIQHGASTAQTPPVSEEFVGADACRDCHLQQYDAWSASTHGRAGGRPSTESVVAPFDGEPLHFTDATVFPEIAADGTYQFRVERDGRPTLLYQIDAVIGRGHLLGGGTQGFASAFTDGTLRFLPFDYSVSDGAWFCNTAPLRGWWTPTTQAVVDRLDAGWVPITEDLRLAACGDWPPVRVMGSNDRFANCAQCHGSQITLTLDPAEKQYVSDATSFDVNCESCHGPGARHVQLARTGRLASASNLAIASLDLQSEDASLTICFQCHAIKGDLTGGYVPGRELEQHYSLGLPLLTDQPLYADGRVRTFAYQQGHRASACYLDGAMTCVDCHDPHAQGYRDINRRPLAGPYDDGQCLACHASMAADPSRHTRHEAATPASQCVTCHMPYLQHPDVGPRVSYARSDHAIAIPRPEFDASRGIENACAQCHADRSASALTADLQRLWGPVRPLRPLVAAVESPRIDLDPGRLLRPDVEDPVAQVLALRVLMDADTLWNASNSVATTSWYSALRSLSDAADLDVRSIARAFLHLMAGDDPDVRAFLGPRGLAPSSHASTSPERARWRAVLRWAGDRKLERGRAVEAIVAYDKALRVWPDHAGVLSDLGSAYASIEDFPNALTFYDRSLAADPGRSAVHVNRGVVLERMGRPEPAVEAYLSAIDANPWDALAHANLGNVLFVREEYGRAIEWYRSAVSIDPTLTDTALLLAQSHLFVGQPDSALMYARNVLELDPRNAPAQRMIEDLGGVR